MDNQQSNENLSILIQHRLSLKNSRISALQLIFRKQSGTHGLMKFISKRSISQQQLVLMLQHFLHQPFLQDMYLLQARTHLTIAQLPMTRHMPRQQLLMTTQRRLNIIKSALRFFQKMLLTYIFRIFQLLQHLTRNLQVMFSILFMFRILQR